MSDEPCLYPDRLRDGRTEQLDEELAPEGIGVEFCSPVRVTGEAYLAGDCLVLMLNLSAEVAGACRICNEEVRVPVTMQGHCHTEDLAEHKSAVVPLTPIVRGILLVEVPAFVECGGECPNRGELGKMKKNHGFTPFEGIE